MLPCKLCQTPAPERFRVPADRHPGLAEPKGELVPYHACPRCGFLFSTHLDAPDAKAPYDESYFSTVDPGAADREGLPLALVAQAERWLGHRRPRVLDFGSGTGRAVAKLREAGYQAEGVDIVTPEVASEHIRVGLLDAHERYDAVTAIEVFEHLPDPAAAARAIARSLVPGGLLAMTTALHDPRALDPSWWYIAPGAGHISLYTEAALAELARATGFHPLLCTPTNHLWIKAPLPPGGVPLLKSRMLWGRLRDKLTR